MCENSEEDKRKINAMFVGLKGMTLVKTHRCSQIVFGIYLKKE